MRIVSLESFITQTLHSLGRGADVVGVGEKHASDLLPDGPSPVELFKKAPRGTGLAGALGRHMVDISELARLAPDRILTRLPVLDERRPEETLQSVRDKLSKELGDQAKLFSYHPVSIDGVYDFLTSLGVDVGAAEKGRLLASRMKAQFMDWGDNFYDRMKNKKVTFLSSIAPLRTAGWWVGDMIKIASAQPQTPIGRRTADLEDFLSPIKWDEIIAFRPDVIMVSVEGRALEESVQTFSILEKMPGWETLPAVKRGEVVFASGVDTFFDPCPSLIDAMAILVSAIAGFDSGYITKRDSFFRLRYIEMQRHKFFKKVPS